MCLVNNKYNGRLDLTNIKKFYFSRFKALSIGWYIAFFIIFLINTVVLIFLGKTLSFGSNRGGISIICNLLFLHGFLSFCNNNVMPGGWYIGTTVILYALTPLIFTPLKRTKTKKKFLLISSIVGIFIWSAFHFIFRSDFDYNGFSYFFFPIHYPEYLLGMVLYYDVSNKILKINQKKYLFAGLLGFVIAIVFFYSKFSQHHIFSAWMTAIATYLVLYYMIYNEKNNKRYSFSKIICNFGRNSYCIEVVN